MLTDSQMRFYLYCLYGLLQHRDFLGRGKGSQIDHRRAQMIAYHAFWEVGRQRGKW